MPNADGAQGDESLEVPVGSASGASDASASTGKVTTGGGREKRGKSRQRASLSCRECRRRKQKCNQTKDRPCNNCARRYPPVECVYDSIGVGGKRDRSKEKVGSEGQSPGLDDRHQRLDSVGLPSRAKAPSEATLTRISPPGFNVPPYSPRVELDEQTDTASRRASREVRELSPATRERLQTHSGSHPDISSIFLIDRPRSESQYFNQFDASSYGIDLVPRPIGVSAENVVEYLPLDATRRNAELLHFFVQKLSPFTSSLDGHNPSPVFTAQWIPFMIQSPLVVYLSILSAAYFQATARRINVEKSVDAITIRTKLIGLINEHISDAGGGAVSDEAVATVMSLSYNELIYSDRKSVLAHMTGLRSMVRTRGGLERIRTPVLRLLLARTDYQISLTFECEPFLHQPRAVPIPSLRSFPAHLDSPFIISPNRFTSYIEKLNLPLDIAQLLDDMRFLTSSIHALLHDTPSTHINTATVKFIHTSKWLFSRLSSSPIATTSSPLYQTLHATSLILLTAITSHSPLSQSCAPEVLQRLWGNMWRVPLPRWKMIPGIFLWVLLVVNPAVRDRPEGRFVKSMVAAGFVGVGVEVDGKDVVEGIVRGAGAIQLWLERERWRGREGNDDDVVVVMGRVETVGGEVDVEDVVREPERVLNS